MSVSHKQNSCYGKDLTKKKNKKNKQKANKQERTILHNNYYYMHMNFI